MKPILNVYKPIGVTPLEIIKQIRKHFPEHQQETIGYAGRLDPLAHGVLLLMLGEANKQREKYLGFSKEYVFEALFGVDTDSHDIMGILQKKHSKETPATIETQLKKLVKEKIGKQKQTYPVYSSKTVEGKPLYWWAKENKLDEITIPSKEITINTFELLKMDTITKEDLQKKVIYAIHTVKGDFRQEETEIIWQQFLEKEASKKFVTATFSISCSSGTYIRKIISTIGEELGTGAIALDILRTKVGEYSLKDSLRLE